MASKQTHAHCSRCSSTVCATSARHSVLLPAPGRPHSASKQAGACCRAMRCSLDAVACADASRCLLRPRARRNTQPTASFWRKERAQVGASCGRVRASHRTNRSLSDEGRADEGTTRPPHLRPSPCVNSLEAARACGFRLRERAPHSPHSLPWRCARRRVSCSATAAPASCRPPTAARCRRVRVRRRCSRAHLREGCAHVLCRCARRADAAPPARAVAPRGAAAAVQRHCGRSRRRRHAGRAWPAGD